MWRGAWRPEQPVHTIAVSSSYPAFLPLCSPKLALATSGRLPQSGTIMICLTCMQQYSSCVMLHGQLQIDWHPSLIGT